MSVYKDVLDTVWNEGFWYGIWYDWAYWLYRDRRIPGRYAEIRPGQAKSCGIAWVMLGTSSDGSASARARLRNCVLSSDQLVTHREREGRLLVHFGAPRAFGNPREHNFLA